MSAVSKRRQLEAETARRSIEAAERAEAPEPEGPANPFADPAYLARQAEKQRRDRQRLFGPEPEPEDPPSKPQGSADGGEGEPEEINFDTTLDGQRFQVFTDDELYGDNPKGT